MNERRKQELLLIGMKIREKALEAIQAANSGHVGGSFSLADILAVLYFEKMNIDPKNPRDEDRDRFVLSKGHCTPSMYATLALRGYFPVKDLKLLEILIVIYQVMLKWSMFQELICQQAHLDRFFSSDEW